MRTLNGEAEGYERACGAEFAPNGRRVAVSRGDRIPLYDICDPTTAVPNAILHENE